MKNIKFKYLKITLLLGLVFIVTTNCERDLSEDAELAVFPTVGDIFTDTFVGMGSNFYFPFAGSRLDAFSVDDKEGYESSSSYRVDVPNADDPNGNYAGAILRVDGAGRNLSGYDALTFWAKASIGVSLDAIGFGQDFLENKFQVNANNFSIGTNWTKYTIPIPDASRLVDERGLFWYAAGTQATGGSGYVIWFDDIKFEKLGTIGQPRPAISNGNEISVNTFIGVSIPVTGLIETFNLASGLNQTVAPTPSYFEFTSSNPSVASVDASGIVSVLSAGTATITASLGNIEAEGSLIINSSGQFEFAPEPTRDPSNVTSIFSDFYTNTPVDFFNGFWQPFQTTESAHFTVEGDNILNYTNFNFVGNQFSNPTVNASIKSNLHLNMYIPGEVPANFDFLISVVDFGVDGIQGGGDDTRQQIFVSKADVVANSWITIEAPLNLLTTKNNVGLIIYENINGSSLSNFYLDNIYFYKD